MLGNKNIFHLIARLITIAVFLFFVRVRYAPADYAGELICGTEHDQQAPVVVYADSDNYLIVWQDYRSGVSFDIYGAGIYEGVTFGPVPICTASRDQKNPAVAWDGIHYVVVWEDNRGGSFYDIYGVRIAKSGALLNGTSNTSGIKICSATKNQIHPDLVWNGKDCFLVVWEDHRNSDADIYGTRVGSDLALYDGHSDDGGIALCMRAGEQESPSVAWNGENFFVVWEDHVSAEVTDIRGLRLSPAGNVLDDAWDGGIVISADNDIQRNPDVVSDGEKFLVVWDTHTAEQGYPDIYGVLVDKAGHVTDDEPISISTAVHNQVNPSVSWTGDNYICFWKDDRKGKVDVYWTRLDNQGRPLNSDPENGGISLGLTTESCIYTAPANAFVQAKGIVVWEENYTGQLDLYAMELIPPVPPILEWALGAGYESDGVEPDKGFGGEIFIFQVLYKDKEAAPPQIAQVWIDLDGDNVFTFPKDKKVDMSPAADDILLDYSEGVIYKAEVPLEYKKEQGIGYRFYFKDELDEAIGAPTRITHVMVENNPPVLSWCDESGFYSDGVDPNMAEGSFTFKFMVNYRDTEGDLPEVAEVWVDLDDSGTYEQRERFIMQEADQEDIDSGRNYKKAVKILYAGDGQINYRFLFTDGYHLAVGDQDKGDPTKSHTLTVKPHLKAPILSWPTDDGFNSGVHLGAGGEENKFIFKIGYRDPDNDAPVTTQVWVDLNGDRIFTEDERFKMSPEGTQDGDFTQVNYYVKQMSISYSGDGEMLYKFVFDDGWNIATGEPFLEGGSIMVESPISLEWPIGEAFNTDGVNPDSGQRGAFFEFRVIYKNQYGYPPVMKEIWVDENLDSEFGEEERYTMEDADPTDIDYTDGKEYVRPIQYKGEKIGFIPYIFMFSDIYMSAVGPPAEEGLAIQILNAGDTKDQDNDSVDPATQDQLALEILEAGGRGCFIESLWNDMPPPAHAGIGQEDTLLGPIRPPVSMWMTVFKFGLGIILLMALICFVLFGYSTVKGR